jgi:hypothetical protein
MTGKPKAPSLQLVAPRRAPSQLHNARALARAMAEQDKVRQAVAEATAKVAAGFPAYAAGRRITLAQARAELEATGFLAPPKAKSASQGESADD